MKKIGAAVLADQPHVDRRTAISGLTSLAGVAMLGPFFSSVARAGRADFGISQVADGVFVHRGEHGLQRPDNHGDISNASFIVGRDAVAVIDTSGSYLAGEELRAAISAQTDRPIRYVINTHMHPDHVLGNAAFKSDGVGFVGHAKLARALAARGERYLNAALSAMGEEAFKGTEIVLPSQSIEGPTTLDLGDRLLTLKPQATAHTDNDLVIVDETTKTLFAGDLIFSGHTPALDGSIVGWIKVLEDLADTSANRIVPGHGPEMMAVEEAAKPMLRYLKAVADGVREVIATGGTMNEAMNTVAAGEREKWVLFEEFHRRNVSAAFAELEWE